MLARGWARGEWAVLLQWVQSFSFREDEKVLEKDGADGRTETRRCILLPNHTLKNG